MYSATVLSLLAKHFADMRNESSDDINIGSKFDLIAGTSTGGILAVALASGVKIDKIIQLYKEHGKEIFPQRNSQPEGLKLLWWAFKFLFRPSGNRKALEIALKEMFGSDTLGDLYSKNNIALCIPTVNVCKQKTRVFKTPHLPKYTRDKWVTAVDVCLATSAAPFYLPLSAVKDRNVDAQDICADGGLWANNPVLVALSEALEVVDDNREIEIVSVSTCPPQNGCSIEYDQCKRGVWGWRFGCQALLLSLESQAEGHQHIAEIIARNLKRRCSIIRLPSTPPSTADAKHFGLDMSSSKAIAVMEDQAKLDVSKIQSSVDANLDVNMALLKKIL